MHQYSFAWLCEQEQIETFSDDTKNRHAQTHSEDVKYLLYNTNLLAMLHQLKLQEAVVSLKDTVGKCKYAQALQNHTSCN